MGTLRILFPLIICLLISIITLYLYIYVLRNTDYYSEIKNNQSSELKQFYKTIFGENIQRTIKYVKKKAA